MNWTGGRLQRHSRSNTNHTNKLQKQHFAKARLGLPTETTNHNHSKQILFDAPENSEFLSGVEHGSTIPSSSIPYGPHVRYDVKIKQSTSQGLEQIKLLCDLEIPSSSQFLLTQPNKPISIAELSEPEKHTSTSRSTKLFEETRQTLLDQADWPGITAARPLKIAFPLRKEMRRSGGLRRNVIRTRGDMQDVESSISDSGSRREPGHESYKADSVRSVRYHSPRKASKALPTNNPQPYVFSSVLDLNQPRSVTLTDHLRPKHCQNLSEKYDILGAIQVLPSTSDTNNSADSSNKHRLLSLSDARDCTNFDEIREKSSQYSMQHQLCSPQPADQSVYATARFRPCLQDRFTPSQQIVSCPVRHPFPDNSSYDTQTIANDEYAKEGKHEYKELDDQRSLFTPKLPQRLMPLQIKHKHLQLKRKAVDDDDFLWGRLESVASSSPIHRRPLTLDMEQTDFAQSSRKSGTAFDSYNRVLPRLHCYDVEFPSRRTVVNPEQHGMILPSSPRTPFAGLRGMVSPPEDASLPAMNITFTTRFDDNSSIVGSVERALLQSDLRSSSSSTYAISVRRRMNPPTSYARTFGASIETDSVYEANEVLIDKDDLDLE